MELAIATAGAILVLMLIAIVLSRKKAESGRPSAMPLDAYALTPDPASVDEEPDVTTMGRVPSIARDEDDESDARIEAAALVELSDEEVEEESAENTGPQALILVTAICRTDKGMHRTNNEDSLLALPDENLYAVADGMGGYAGGEIASKIAVDTIGAAFRAKAFPGIKRRTPFRRANELVRAVELANEAILKEAIANPAHADMGTTIVATRFSPSKRRVYVASVGDSRVYRVRAQKLEQLTSDHTLALEAGIRGKMGAQLSRALGVKAHVKTDIKIEDARPGDHYVVCSDGLTKMVTDEQILACVLQVGLEDAAKKLVAQANAQGGRDNISVVLIRVDHAGGSLRARLRDA